MDGCMYIRKHAHPIKQFIYVTMQQVKRGQLIRLYNNLITLQFNNFF